MGIAPAATWYGRPIRIPQTLLAEWLPLYRTLRETFRLGIAGLMGLSLAAGLGFALCAARLPSRGRAAAFGGTLLALVVAGEMYREYRGPSSSDAGRCRAVPAAPAARRRRSARARARRPDQGPVLGSR
jgi:hypothetical protein